MVPNIMAEIITPDSYSGDSRDLLFTQRPAILTFFPSFSSILEASVG
jgi:hypothetical protein